MINEITNFFRISENLATSGMPQPTQFGDIAAAGYQVVINLAADESSGQVTDEKEVIEGLGMTYIHIPVVWERPRIEDLKLFFQAMDANSTQRVFVHCVANYRVSAFIYLYRTLRQNTPKDQADKDLRSIWNPQGVWAEFIDQAPALLSEK